MSVCVCVCAQQIGSRILCEYICCAYHLCMFMWAMWVSVCAHISKTHTGTSFFYVFVGIACEMHVHDE